MANDLSEQALQELVAKAQEGDSEAFGQVYAHFFPSVYRFMAFRVDAAIAEDLVADTFVKAWEKLASYKLQKGVPFGAWIFRIARTTLIDAYRARRPVEELSDTLHDPDALNTADGAVRQQYVLHAVRKAIDTLPQRYRDILSLSYIAELPTDEVARVLGRSEGAIRILKFRALKRLEAALPIDVQDIAPEFMPSPRNAEASGTFSSMEA